MKNGGNRTQFTVKLQVIELIFQLKYPPFWNVIVAIVTTVTLTAQAPVLFIKYIVIVLQRVVIVQKYRSKLYINHY